MSIRHISRSIVLQILFEFDSTEWDIKKVGSLIKYHEENIGKGDTLYTKQLLDTVLQKKEEIDEVIIKSAPSWPLDRIAVIDRNILRIGLSELLFNDYLDVPPKVAINESIELAKEYGGEKSAKFINGVLGGVYKEIGEPRKNEGNKHKNKATKIEELAGAVVYAKYEGEFYFAIVHDIFGKWTLTKGRREEDETLEECAIREANEEMGLKIVIKEKLGMNEYIANDVSGANILKKVTYFLAESDFTDIVLGSSNGLDDSRWFKLKDVVNLNIYQDILHIITDGITKLSQYDVE